MALAHCRRGLRSRKRYPLTVITLRRRHRRTRHQLSGLPEAAAGDRAHVPEEDADPNPQHGDIRSTPRWNGKSGGRWPHPPKAVPHWSSPTACRRSAAPTASPSPKHLAIASMPRHGCTARPVSASAEKPMISDCCMRPLRVARRIRPGLERIGFTTADQRVAQQGERFPANRGDLARRIDTDDHEFVDAKPGIGQQQQCGLRRRP